MVRDESHIKGLELPNGVVSLLLYVDDVTGLVADVESAKLFFTIVKMFGQYRCSLVESQRTSEVEWSKSKHWNE